jgi:hypothetical protein
MCKSSCFACINHALLWLVSSYYQNARYSNQERGGRARVIHGLSTTLYSCLADWVNDPLMWDYWTAHLGTTGGSIDMR